ncbi:30S ribosomal protein S16 [Patescibacteria group bacterium]|nr:30S ribosomal protein S16 [Patescibacteria group bacterium]
MLKIRLSRTGRTNYPAYRIVVAEHSSAVKGKFQEILGHYLPSRNPKVLEYDEKKIKEWIAKGAKPSDTVASLLKRNGVSDMEKFIEPRTKKRKSKHEPEVKPEIVAAPAPAEEAPAEKPAEEAPAEEKSE